MTGRLGIALVLALTVATFRSANASPSPGPRVSPILGGRGATAVISDATPGARPVALIIRLRTELQCGRFTPTLIAVSLPPSMRVPSSVSKTAVTVAGKAAALVQTHGSRFLINTTAPKPGVICDVISPGVVSIKFGLLAGLGNPLRAGFYAFTVTASPRGGSWHGVLSIH